MVGVLVLALAAVALAFFALADDEPGGGPPVAATPTVAPPPDPATTPTPAPSPTPAPDDTPQPDPVADWPAGESAWTIVLNSTTSRSAARRRAQDFIAEGIPDVGVLRSGEYPSLEPGFWVVFSGQYDSARAAARAQRELTGAPASAYVREVTPG